MNESNPRKRVGVVAVLLALLVVLAGAAADAGNLDRKLERLMRKARVPGLSTAIVVGDEVVQTGGYGWANPEEGIAVTPDTLFLLASATKPLTATVAMRLVDRKLIDLDADVNQYLPFEVRNPHFPGQAITLRQLLSHTSSIRDQGWYDRPDELVSHGDWPGTLTQFLIDYLIPGGLYYSAESFWEDPPGARARYSSVGTAVVGAVVEHVVGAPFEDVGRELLFDPLGMVESSYRLSDLDVDHVAVPCGWNGESYEAYPHMGFAPFPSGTVRTSAVQLANFARLHLNGGKFEGRRILKRKTAARMARLHSSGDRNWGLGFEVGQDGDRRIAFHGGGFTGVTTELWLGLDEGIGVVVLTNGEPHELRPSAVRAFFKIRDRLIKQARRIAERGPGWPRDNRPDSVEDP